jgi:hypothetical protein
MVFPILSNLSAAAVAATTPSMEFSDSAIGPASVAIEVAAAAAAAAIICSLVVFRSAVVLQEGH